MPSTIPQHLKKYINTQNYDRYTPENQATWRYIMRQLVYFLKDNAHPAYIEGLKKTGISIESIPRIEVMNKKLQEFGWGAVPVSGFIPPAAFMEFQSLSVLPIAADMRSVEHIHYTPAPDIVHEAAGHAPILVNSEFSQYLKSYAEVASKAIISSEDILLYKAIRELSDIKESPNSTAEEIARYEAQLNEATEKMSYVSEAALLGRMNWWTAEYGLIGPLDDPKVFGAGLLSSIGEVRECLSSKVEKIPLSVDCIKYSYDITEPQPQLFVTESFERLTDVLEELAEKMSYRRGGEYGLEKMLEAQTINSAQLNSGIQVSGLLSECLKESGQTFYLKFSGPCQLSIHGTQLEGHGKDFHSQGYGTPLGHLRDQNKCLSDWSSEELKNFGIVEGQRVKLNFANGVEVHGHLEKICTAEGKNVLLSFSDCAVHHGDNVLFDPSWGQFDMAIGSHVESAFGGPADRLAFGEVEDFATLKISPQELSPRQVALNQVFQKIRILRDTIEERPENFLKSIEALAQVYLKDFPEEWLLGVELVEVFLQNDVDSKSTIYKDVCDHLKELAEKRNDLSTHILRGLEIAPLQL